MKKQGFTLVELLAIIVIIGVIAVIAVPMILNVVADSKKEAAIENAKRYISSIEDAMVEGLDDSTFPIADQDGCYSLQEINKWIDFKGGKPQGIGPNTMVCVQNGKVIRMDEISINEYDISYTEEEGIIVHQKINDKTPPTDTKPSGVAATNQITVISNQEDLESGITKIEYAIYKDNTWSSYQESNIFKNLKNNTTYKIKTRATNKSGLISESKEGSVTTNDIPIPTYTVSPQTEWATKRTVTITYPDKEGLSYYYSLDGGTTWKGVTGVTKNVEFTSNGNIIAKVTDGINTVTTSSYAVKKIDITSPSVSISSVAITKSAVMGNSPSTKTATINISDNESGIKYWCVTTTNSINSCQTTSSTVTTSTGTTNTWFPVSSTSLTSVKPTFVTTTTSTYYVFAKDMLGNVQLAGVSFNTNISPSVTPITNYSATQGQVEIARPSSSSNPTIITLKNSAGVRTTVGLRVNMPISAGDTIKVSYSIVRSNNQWYLDLHDNMHSNNLNCLEQDIQFSKNGQTRNVTFTAPAAASFYQIMLSKTAPSNPSAYYATLSIYEITINGEKVL